MRPLSIVTLVALLALALPAQAQVNFGGQLSFADDLDFGVGARALFDTGDVVAQSRVEAAFDFYFPDEGGFGADVTAWILEANAHYFFPIENSPVNVYAGAGFHYWDISYDIEFTNPFTGDTVSEDGGDDGIGLNILGGVEFPLENSSVTPFAELKLQLSGAEQFILTGGVVF